MAFVRMQAAIQRDTGIAADVQSNTWYFESDADSATALAADAAGMLQSFYGDLAAAVLPGEIFAGTGELKGYDLADAEPRVPIFEGDLGITAYSGAESLPQEVSMVLSFQAERQSGVKQSRRRGRVYLPTMIESQGSVGNGNWRWTVLSITSVLGHLSTALATLGSGNQWAVFSPTTFAETGSLATAFNDVDNGWIDNEPDIQRRRGAAGGVKTPFTVTV